MYSKTATAKSISSYWDHKISILADEHGFGFLFYTEST